jgi:hypothetical protein
MIGKPFAAIAILSFLVLGAAWAAADDLEQVQQAIAGQGLRWTAAPPLFTFDDFRARLGGRASDIAAPPRPERFRLTLPATFDWRNENAVTPVRDQGMCGSCWAFSAVAALESAAVRTAGYPLTLDLSEQYLVSCESDQSGCVGGYLTNVLAYLRGNGTVDSACFPYGELLWLTGEPVESCAPCSDWQTGLYKVGDYASVNADVDSLKQAVYQNGPLSVTMDVYEDFYFYFGGIYSYAWGKLVGSHVILLIGWDDADQCFVVKNSWGTWWGEKGFFRIAYSEVGGKTQFASEAYWVAFGSGPGCTAATCPNGCCDGTQCLPGTADAACGAGGAECVACAAGKHCQSGQCAPGADDDGAPDDDDDNDDNDNDDNDSAPDDGATPAPATHSGSGGGCGR